MSQSGSYTPLQINTLTQLSNDSGFAINAVAAAIMGTYTPTNYTQGTLTNNTVLERLTASIPNFYELAKSGQLELSVYRALLSIGSGVCPALGNSKPDTFTPSYPGYGSWQGNTLVGDSYPPKGYPTNGQYSYIYQAYGNYAYITGWPGKNSWQKDTDEYAAAYPPSTPSTSAPDYDKYFSNGFVACLAQQAYNEMFVGKFNQYNNIVNAFQLYTGAASQNNTQLGSLVNSKTVFSSSYSNINDLTTSDLSGVCQALGLFGQDLYNCGKAIDLKNIHRFGTPSVLLLTLQRYGALTQAVGLALQYAGLTTSDLSDICTPTYIPTPEEEKKIYEAFKLISGGDLYSLDKGVTLQLNCRLNNLRTLADLLDPQYLFPSSYPALTVPQYNADLINTKTYYFIYVNGGVNPAVASLGEPLTETLVAILPPDVAIAAAAFSVSMQQVRNIMQSTVEKLSLTISDLELTNKNLPLLNTTTGTPVNVTAVNNMIAQYALGSGNSGTTRQCDFFGAACGYPYNTWTSAAEKLLEQASTPRLRQIYQSIFNLSRTAALPAPQPVDPILSSNLQTLIDDANSEISAINSTKSEFVQPLNTYWNYIGNQLLAEQRSIPLAIPQMTEITATYDRHDFQTFVQSLETYAQQNTPGDSGSVLAGISDLTTLGGQSLVGSMREARNAQRLNWSGVPPENDIPNAIDINSASAIATLDSSGSIVSVTMTNNSSGYTLEDPPRVYIYPYGYLGVLIPVIEVDGSISSLVISNPGRGYPWVEILIDPPPASAIKNRKGNTIPPVNVQQPTFPGPGPFTGFSDNPYLPGPIPPLPPEPSATPTVPEAIDDVTKCNCDCWNL
jgi:hypothetical protein